MARGAEYGFLKLTYLLIIIYVNFENVGNKKVGKGLGLYPPFQILMVIRYGAIRLDLSSLQCVKG